MQNKMDKTIYTPKTFLSEWRQENHTFDVSVVRSIKRGNVTVDYFYFNGNGKDGAVTRVYCVAAYTTLPAPCVIKVGEIGKPIDIDELAYFAVKGYAAYAIDYAGDMGQGLHTVYPNDLSYANLKNAGRKLEYVDATARDTTWYEWDVNTLYLLDYLVSNKCTEDNKVALYAVGEYASRIAVHLMGSDKRIKAGAIAFGNIWEETLRSISPMQQLSITELTASVAELDEEERWLSAIAPQAYLQYVTQPMYLITGANSMHSNIMGNHIGMTRCKNVRSRHLYLSGLIDRVITEVLFNIAEWFRICLNDDKEIPTEPHLAVRAKEGKLYAALKKENNEIEIFYTRLSSGNSHNWNKAALTQDERWVKGNIDVYDVTQEIVAFANVKQGKLSISTDPVKVLPQEYAVKEVERSRILYEGSQMVGSFIPLAFVNAQAYTPSSGVSSAEGPYGISGVKGSQFGTFAVAEYPFGDKCSYISFDLYTPTPCEMECLLISGWGSEEQKIYTKRITVTGGELWQKAQAELKEFKTASGKPFDVEDRQSLSLLCFDCQLPITINNVIFG